MRAAVEHLERGPMTCSNLGSLLWGKFRKPQAYARPAGRVLRALERLGYVRTYFDDFNRHFMWEPTHRGRNWRRGS